jgi:hypothetical protein
MTDFVLYHRRDERSASHAGDWYSDNGMMMGRSSSPSCLLGLQGIELDSQLSAWLSRVDSAETPFPIQGCKAIIAPLVQ